MKKLLISLIILLPGISYASTYSTNKLIGGTCTASSVHAIGPCANAFDENLATRWIVNDSQAGSYPHWIGYDLGTTTIINKVTLNTYNDGGYQYGKDFQILGSNDNWSSSSTIFTGQLTRTAIDFNGNGTTESFTFDTNTTAYRYYRLNFTSDMSPANTTQQWDWYGYTCLDCNSATSTPITNSALSDQFNSYLSFLLDIIVIVGIALIIIWVFR